MRVKEPKVMQELHQIRRELHNETRNMSVKERVKWIHQEAEKAKKELNLKLRIFP